MKEDVAKTEAGEEGNDVRGLAFPATAPTQISARLGRLVRLCLKELREILRDRRTIVTLVLMPLLVYPLLAILFNRLLSFTQKSNGQTKCIVGFESEEQAKTFEELLVLGNRLIEERRRRFTASNPTAKSASDPPTSTADEMLFEWVMGKNVRVDVAKQQIDVAVFLQDRPHGRPDSVPQKTRRVEFVYRPSSSLARAGVAYLEERLSVVNNRYLLEQLWARGVDAHLVASVVHKPIHSRAATVSLTTLIPLILILMTITGAVYPAIDLTAGERERGTLETLMAAPVPRLGLLTAKYVAVVTVAMLTASANLLAMSITVVSTGMSSMVFGDAGLTPMLVCCVFALLILFAAFFSAILLALTSFARSFKEAQAYLIPVMLLALAPGMMSLMPDLKFSSLLSVLPLANIVLLARDLFEGQVDATLAVAAVLSTAIYAAAAIALAARIFGTDAILYGSQASWSDLLSASRHRRIQPSVSAALFCLALMFPLYFVTANLLSLSTLSVLARLFVSASATVLLFGLLPVALVLYQRIPLASAFRLRSAGVVSYVAAAILGLTLWPLAHEVFLLNRTIGIATLTEEQIQAAQKLVASWKEISPAVVLVTLALVPAVCEELFFRGYLFGAFRRVTSPAGTILFTAVLFGIFHVVVTSMLAVERFLPSTFLGLLLGWVCWRSESTIPGMVLHALHNGLLLMMAYYQTDLKAMGWGIQEQQHLPVSWVAATFAGVLVGVVTLFFSTSPPADGLPPQSQELSMAETSTLP